MNGRHHLVVFSSILALALPASVHASPIFYGPLAYVQHGDSPFNGLGSSYAYLETFEDGLVNTRGLTASGGIVIGLDPFVDSVDAEDGAIDGYGSPGSHSLWSNFTESALTFTFDAELLGALPTYAGIVWTDIGYNSPTPYYGPVSFEAFGAAGQSLGSIGPYLLGDGIDTGQTAEDRLFGVYDPSGVSSIRISTNTSDWEVDDVQYGREVKPVPEPATLLLVGLGLSVLGYRHRGSMRRPKGGASERDGR